MSPDVLKPSIPHLVFFSQSSFLSPSFSISFFAFLILPSSYPSISCLLTYLILSFLYHFFFCLMIILSLFTISSILPLQSFSLFLLPSVSLPTSTSLSHTSPSLVLLVISSFLVPLYLLSSNNYLNPFFSNITSPSVSLLTCFLFSYNLPVGFLIFS